SAGSARAANTRCTRNASTATCGRCAPPRSEMGIFRRRKEESLNEQMLREAGIAPNLDSPGLENRPDSVTASTNDVEPEPFDPFAGTYPADTQWLGSL